MSSCTSCLEVHDLARRIAAFGLGATEEPVSVRTDLWPALTRSLQGHRLLGLATSGWETGALLLDNDQGEELLELQRVSMMQSLAIERRLMEASTALGQAGVEALVLKGPALAHTFYDDPSLRPFGDLDLLVESVAWTDAGTALERLGYVRKLPEPRSGFDVRFGKGATYRDETGLEIDMHRTLVAGPYGAWMDADEVVRSAVTLSIGSRPLQRLDDTMLLVHACVHAALGMKPGLLLPLRDLMQVVTAAEIDHTRFEDIVDRWRLGPVVQHAFANATHTLRVEATDLMKSFQERRFSRRESRALRAYTTGRRKVGGPARATVLALPSLREKLAYIRALALPSRSFVGDRNDDSYARRWMVPLRWITKGGR